MNKENIIRLAEALETLSVKRLGFNMGLYAGHFEPDEDRSGRGCETCACIAGWAVAIKTKRSPLSRHGGISRVAREFLGLDLQTAHDLFTPGEGSGARNPYKATPRQAAAVLRHLAETGKVRWSKAWKVAS